MERLFSPCTRFHDILASQGRLAEVRGNHPALFQELNLDVSTEELLSSERAFTYADLHAMLESGDTVAWLTPHAVVAWEDALAVIVWNHLDNQSCHFYFNADGKDIIAWARSSDHLLEICDVILRLLAVSVVHIVRLIYPSPPGSFINAPTLAYLMEQCQSMNVLTLGLEMDEDHCRVLGDFSRPDLEILLHLCKITSAGASALTEVLGRNQGPTKIYSCEIDNVVLADGLRGNSLLESLRPRFSSDLEVHDREFLAIAGAVKENKGLVDLNLSFGISLNDVTWGTICDSLVTHPTLEVLGLRGALAPSVLQSRMQALVDMMKVNMSIHTIHLDLDYSEHKLYRESIIPYLETNRLRPRLLAIQQTRPIHYRAKVLVRALLAVRTDPNCFWMLLSGNVEVAFPTIAVAANLPLPAAAAAAVMVAPVVATASSAAASNAVAPAACQKRKACP
jgi:hypothetical protein